MSTQTITFTGNGSWVCPANITSIILTGFGGGGGGASFNSGQTDIAGGGGGASIQICSTISVVPGTSYNINIGIGGQGGMAGTGFSGNKGSDGGNTTFINSGIILFSALGGGAGFPSIAANGSAPGGGISYALGLSQGNLYFNNNCYSFHPLAGNGAPGRVTSANDFYSVTAGYANVSGGYLGGTSGIIGASGFGGGGGGGAGPGGNGANGGNGVAGGVSPNAGSDASANSGAGGGGAGGSTVGSAVGGNGGSGQLTIAYIV